MESISPKHGVVQMNLGRMAFRPELPVAGDTNITAPGFTFEPMLSAACSFDAEIYLKVVMNMIRNPNLTTTHLFRADVFYDSANDVHFSLNNDDDELSSRVKAMKPECRPLRINVQGYELKRTIVRQLMPRNPNLDRPLTQTCHVFENQNVQTSTANRLVVYLPHAHSPETIPWYHPAVRALAVLHEWKQNVVDHTTPQGKVSIHFDFFPHTERTTRQERTALKFLSIVHKHGEGTRLGYVKKVNHDVIIPQARFQDTYSRLKIQYAKQLIGGWVEQTPPEKHVFEDLGIAAFLIELWKDMYASMHEVATSVSPSDKDKPPFPGFVDIGCGNGILVYILLLEGYKGWGFDARHRKTWDTLPNWVQTQLQERILVPEPFSLLEEVESKGTRDEQQKSESKDITKEETDKRFVNGVFPNSPFIVSNHADELTAWTPLLAYLSNSPFISIPCCSHDLSGARFRAPVSSKGSAGQCHKPLVVRDSTTTKPNAAETGSLAKAKHHVPSAFASLCMYVERLSAEVGITPEKEILRIPSTRNTAILGRWRTRCDDGHDDRRGKVVGILERELKMGVADVGRAWIGRANQISRTKGDGH